MQLLTNETGTKYGCAPWRRQAQLGVPYSPSWVVLVSPGIASDDGDELQSCSEAGQDAVLQDGGPATRDNTQGARVEIREGRSTARGRKGPNQPEFTMLGWESPEKATWKESRRRVNPKPMTKPSQAAPSHSRGEMNQAEGQAPAPGSSDPRQMQGAFPRGSGPYHKP